MDIGGTKIASVIIDENAKVLYRSEFKSDPTDKDSMFKQVVLCIEEVMTKAKIEINDVIGIGVGVPGKVDNQNGIAIYQNNLPWGNFPVKDKLKDYFSINNISIDNDVYMAALAEWKLTSLDNQDTFVYITISTGVSCSIIQKGSFIRGAGFAGEIGLFPVLSGLSTSGITNMEDAVSGSAIQKFVKENSREEEFSIIDFFREYNNGNPITYSTMNKIIESLAHGVYSIVCLLDPHRIVFGGGVLNNNPFLLDLVKNEIKSYLIPEQNGVLERMKVSRLKQNSGVIGAGLKGIYSSQANVAKYY